MCVCVCRMKVEAQQEQETKIKNQRRRKRSIFSLAHCFLLCSPTHYHTLSHIFPILIARARKQCKAKKKRRKTIVTFDLSFSFLLFSLCLSKISPCCLIAMLRLSAALRLRELPLISRLLSQRNHSGCSSSSSSSSSHSGLKRSIQRNVAQTPNGDSVDMCVSLYHRERERERRGRQHTLKERDGQTFEKEIKNDRERFERERWGELRLLRLKKEIERESENRRKKGMIVFVVAASLTCWWRRLAC